jgi:sulfate adenylyltransferase subunit 2
MDDPLSPQPQPDGPEAGDARRRLAVHLRSQGIKLADAARQSGLSMPTVVAAFKAWQQGGWAAVATRPRGRKPIGQQALGPQQEAVWVQRWCSQGEGLWSLARCMAELRAAHASLAALADTQLGPLVLRMWLRAGLAAPIAWDGWRASADPALAEWHRAELPALRRLAREAGATLLSLGERTLPAGQAQLLAHTSRGSVMWVVTAGWPTEDDWIGFWLALREQQQRPLWLLTENPWLTRRPALARWLGDPGHGVRLLHLPARGTALADTTMPQTD